MAPAAKRAAGFVGALLVMTMAALGASRLLAPASPGNAAYWLVNDDPGWTERRLRLQLALMEHAVAACMRDAGLLYQESIADPLDDPDSQLAPRDWAAKYGFGVSTRLDMPPVVEVDPNALYIETLPSDEREIYVKALLGDPNGDPGCRGTAQQETFLPRQVAIEAHASLFDELAVQIRADQRIVTAEDDWYRCASAAGFPVRRTERDVVLHFFTQSLNELRDGTGQVDAAGLVELQTAERKTAVAFIDCDTAYAATTEPVAREVTRVWESQHREELERLRATLTDLDNGLLAMSQQAGLESPN